jgi:hypothetical protein
MVLVWCRRHLARADDHQQRIAGVVHSGKRLRSLTALIVVLAGPALPQP